MHTLDMTMVLPCRIMRCFLAIIIVRTLIRHDLRHWIPLPPDIGNHPCLHTHRYVICNLHLGCRAWSYSSPVLQDQSYFLALIIVNTSMSECVDKRQWMHLTYTEPSLITKTPALTHSHWDTHKHQHSNSPLHFLSGWLPLLFWIFLSTFFLST